MENKTPKQTETLAPSEEKKPSKLPVVVLSTLLLISLAISGFLAYQNSQLKQKLNTKEQTKTQPATQSASQPTKSQSEKQPSSLEETGWIRTDYGGLFSYEYPKGWHVTEWWPESPSQGIMILIDPKPISLAPRGGPIATFEITLKNGLPNPNEVFQQDQISLDTYLMDIQKETIQSDLGPIYYYKGKFSGEMFYGEPVEQYFLTFETNPNDPRNQQVINAALTLSDDPKLSSMLRRIATSIRKK